MCNYLRNAVVLVVGASTEGTRQRWREPFLAGSPPRSPLPPSASSTILSLMSADPSPTGSRLLWNCGLGGAALKDPASSWASPKPRWVLCARALGSSREGCFSGLWLPPALPSTTQERRARSGVPPLALPSPHKPWPSFMLGTWPGQL
jgi:hypothetical protein